MKPILGFSLPRPSRLARSASAILGLQDSVSYLSRVNFLKPHTIVTVIIALVWFVNGLFCKILNLVPRHELIVSRILGADHAAFFTKAIGVGELLIMIWILSGIRPRFATMFQMTIVAVMNVMEFVLVPDLLLFGRFNIVFAAMFVLLIYFNEFLWRSAVAKPTINKEQRS